MMSVPGVGGANQVQMDAIGSLIGNGDIESVMVAFVVERAQNMEALVKAKVADMRARNANIQELQQAMQTIRSYKPSGDSETTTPDSADAEIAKAVNVLAKNGLSVPDGMMTGSVGSAGAYTAVELKGKKEKFDDMLTNMQSKIDELTSNDQLDMIQLQSMVGKQNNAIEMVSNLVSKFQQLKDKIVGNMR